MIAFSNNLVLLSGGTEDFAISVNQTYRCNTTACSNTSILDVGYSQVTTLLPTHHQSAKARDGNNVYLQGGFNGLQPTNGAITISSALINISLTTPIFANIMFTSKIMFGHASVYDAARARIVYFGGIVPGSPSNLVTSMVWTYHVPSTGISVMFSTLRTARYDATAGNCHECHESPIVLIEPYVLIMGGVNGSGTILSSIEVYHLPTDTFMPNVPQLDIPRSGFAAWYDNVTSQVFIWGGATTNSQLADNQLKVSVLTS